MKFRCLLRPFPTISGVVSGRMVMAGFGVTGELDARQVAGQYAVAPEGVAHLVMTREGYGNVIVPADDEARFLTGQVIVPPSPPGQEGAGGDDQPAPSRHRGRARRR